MLLQRVLNVGSDSIARFFQAKNESEETRNLISEHRKMHKNNLSPRSSLSGEEEVLDFPGVEDDSSGSNPVSREAHQFLKEGMDTVNGTFTHR